MTADERQRLKQAIDAHVRAGIQNQPTPRGPRGQCAGCGCDTDTYVEGCHTCSERKRRRWRYQNDPAFAERQRGYDRAKRARRRAAA